jgi:UDPglucose--hexose-1-phosphate uridylyltransferase
MEKPASHRRKNQLNGEWILVSPHRNNRPWHGATEQTNEAELPVFDDGCPLCPGNERVNGTGNPNYTATHVFKNDFGALTEFEVNDEHSHPLFESEEATGMAKVICFSPKHNKTLAQLSVAEILPVVHTWKDEYTSLSQQFNCVHIFENKGEIMGCSQPHPHGQIWAHQHYSTEIEKENTAQQKYFDTHHRAMLADYLAQELKDQKRIVCENVSWVALVPYWAKWPFETILLQKRQIADMTELDASQAQGLAEIISHLTIKYDNVFKCSFPYSMGWHNAPANLKDKSHWMLHAHFYPPLLRSATVKKHMVGYEMMAESQRDLSPEQAAKILQDASDVHYK